MRFDQPRLVPARCGPELELVPFHVASIEPKLASKLMGRLADAAPFKGLQHIKRVRKVSRPEEPIFLDILLCLAQSFQPDRLVPPVPNRPATPGEDDPIYNVLPGAVATIVKEHSLTNIRIQQVAKHAPTTKEQWAEWTKIWPLTWNAPDPKSADPEITLSQDEVETMQRWMQLAFAEAEAAAQIGSAANAAAIVNPSTNTLVAVGRDCTSSHPLHHAAMTAVDAVAAENLRLWPHSCIRPDISGAAPAEATTEKCQKLEGCLDVSQGVELRASHTEDSDEERGSADAAEGWNARPYLCTGYDCYVVQEPCAMCAMALVHSRLRRVVFCRPDAHHGALGGSFKLHSERSLNHHYTVFNLPLK